METANRAQQLGPTPNDMAAFGYIGGAGNPPQGVSLRTIDPDHISIVNVATGAVIEEIEASKAFFEVYDGAVYMFQGRPFLCRRVDLARNIAEVRRGCLEHSGNVRTCRNHSPTRRRAEVW